MMLQTAIYGKIKMIKSKHSTHALNPNIINKKTVNSKRSQFKIQQTAFMLLAVFLFFILVGMFWLTISYKNLQKQATDLGQEQAIFISHFLSSSSEFSCAGGSVQYCVDTDKLLFLQGRSVYDEFWPVSFVKIRRLDWKKEEKECTKVNYPECNIYKVYENNKIDYKGTGAGNYVALCRYEQISGYATRICEIGKIIVGYEAK